MLTDFLAISTTVVADSGVTDVPPEVQLRTRKRPENVEIAAFKGGISTSKYLCGRLRLRTIDTTLGIKITSSCF
mgnify:CR=1 FL=1|tara:strand:+ start:403 stop:624 length:222 start_codon:yes stop_codon:yes gene_type:complete